MADQYEGFSRKDLIKMLEEANDSVEHYEKQCELKDEEYEKMVEEKNEEISELEARCVEAEKELFDLNYGEDSEDEDITTEREVQLTRDYHESLKQMAKQLGGINDKNKAVTTELIKFIAGNYEAEPAVKEAIKREYSQDFIDGNGERWAEIGLEW